ncbi:hypothetical protein ACF0H5_018969 [Mactra antiquata]
MHEEENSLSVSCIVSDYMSYRLQKDGFSWQVSPTRNCPNSRVLSTVRKLCAEFESRYKSQFIEMCSSCSENELDSDVYTNVLEQIIEDGLHWGRVIAIFTYAGAMSVFCMQNNNHSKVDWIKEWTCSFISSRVENWINENGGWKGLVEFYELGNGTLKQDTEWKGWGYLIGGALGLALGALIVNKA